MRTVTLQCISVTFHCNNLWPSDSYHSSTFHAVHIVGFGSIFKFSFGHFKKFSLLLDFNIFCTNTFKDFV